jgi:hypothetical protein
MCHIFTSILKNESATIMTESLKRLMMLRDGFRFQDVAARILQFLGFDGFKEHHQDNVAVFLIPWFLFGFRSRLDYWQPPAFVAGGVSSDHRRVFLAIMSTYYTYHRLPQLFTLLHSHPFSHYFIQPHIFIPPGPTPLPMPVPVTIIDSPANRFLGLCVREDAAMRCYLNKTNNGWFYRGIDDTWVHPENLLDLIVDLVSFLNPMIHIVIKGCKTYHKTYHCAPWMDGGVGWLLSRAAVMHVLEYNFTRVCRFFGREQDDITMGLIACHTFPDHRFWHSWRLPGNPFYLNRRWPIISENLSACPDNYVWPLHRLVALHVQENTIIKDTIHKTNYVSQNLAYYTPHKDSWELCRGNATAFASLTGREELRK